MHAFFEALPFFIGIPSTLLYRVTKPFAFKKACLLILTLLSGFMANRLSGEGMDLLPVDLFQACGSTLICLFLSRSLLKQQV
jgi:hypothetical protein